MARNNNLAGLAALGALGYMLTKDKGQAADQTPGPGRQSQGAGYDSFGTNTGSATDLKTPMQSIADADQSVGSSTSPVMRGETGTTTLGPAYNEPTTATKSTAAAPKTAAPKSKGISYPSGIMAGAAKTSPDMYPSGVMGGKRQADSAASTQPTAKRETYKGLDGKIHYKEPSGPSASQMASDAISSGAKKVGSGIADYVSNFETPAERRSRLSKQPAGMKRGGTVKMASGGMTASRRADGIATKGKTRGKIC
jgi:hypothetical protein